MKLFWAAIALAFLCDGVVLVEAEAFGLCLPAETAVRSLTGKDYRESLWATGLTKGTGHGVAMRLYVNSKTRTWTLLQITPTGVACFMAAGHNFEKVKPEPAGDDT